MTYSKEDHRTYNSEGVDIRVVEFGDTSSMEYLTDAKFPSSSYFKYLVDTLIDMGYERKKQLFGAPYDFRKSPKELENYYVNLKKLIEDSYQTNQQHSIVFISHSMGSKIVLNFLNNMSKKWKQKYVKAFISISGPWLGSIRALRDNLDFPLFNQRQFSIAIKTFSSVAYLLPIPDVWPKNQVQISTPRRNYTASDYKRLFSDTGNEYIFEMWEDSESLSKQLEHPSVPVYCIYGTGKKTIEKLVYTGDNILNELPTEIYGPGDGFVNLYSLSACKRWMNNNKQIQTYTVNNCDHLTILRRNEILNYLADLLKGFEKENS